MTMKTTLLLLAALAALATLGSAQTDCVSPVYCEGPLLHTVQMAGVYEDSKTFVDKKQRQPEAETLAKFDALMDATGGSPDRDAVAAFVTDAFEDAGELIDWTPPDFNPEPALLATIADPDYREWASELNHLWKNLSRKMSTEVADNQERYSIIYVPHGFVVPGGRFREFYYWDTYWIMQGLLRCEMFTTARGMLDNFVTMVRKVGFVPNGGRVYYLNRSQPPLLIPMVASYVEATGDLDFFRGISAELEAELGFWSQHRSVEVTAADGSKHRLARYAVEVGAPRPESYSEDYRLAQQMPEASRERFYQDIRSGAESGWDFSSRWFVASDGSNQGNLSHIRTQDVVPVDLNAFVHWSASLLSDLFNQAGQPDKADEFKRQADVWLAGIDAILWHDDLGVWLDYDLINNKRRDYFFPSNLAPLFTRSFDKDSSAEHGRRAVAYLMSSGAMAYLGGVPTSLAQTGEQWDFPNAWPPLQHIIIAGLAASEDSQAQQMAKEMAQRWVHANYIGYFDKQEMYEKYDAVTPGAYGGGGEYQVQAGFGWTNGVILDLLGRYGPCLSTTYQESESKSGHRFYP